MLAIGLMSGTSMDGIDLSLLETDGSENSIKELGHASSQYSPSFKLQLKAAEYAIREASGNLTQADTIFPQKFMAFLQSLRLDPSTFLNEPISLSAVFKQSAQLHCQLVQNFLEQNHIRQVDIIGYHGQTFYHNPEQRITLSIGDGQYMSNLFKVPVVTDFRQQDVLAGGQGAPFAPLYHFALSKKDHKIPIAVLNCGGIANITLISNRNELDICAFDTGPGNGLIDRLVQQRTGGQKQMDQDGEFGLKGKVHENILALLYEKAVIKNNQNYFQLNPPKSLDIGNLNLIPELDALSLEDACATLAAFTADAIAQSFPRFNLSVPSNVALAGGGFKNPVIIRELTTRLQALKKDVQVFHADDLGWNSQSLEAQIFAYLAVRSIQRKPLSLPGTTGVSKPMTGGKIHIPSS